MSTIGLALGSVFVALILDMTSSYQIAWVCMIAFTVITLAGWIGSYVSSRKYFKTEGHAEESAKKASLAE